MLQIRNLTITHLKDFRTILKDFSFTLNSKDKALIFGEEGNGKSTLLKLIYDERQVSDYIEYTGKIIKNNTRFGYLAQELSNVEKAQNIYEFCSDIQEFFNLNPKELYEIACQLGLSKDIFYSSQLIGTLSGGEKVKLQFAKILMIQPDALLLDEPSNDIDIDTLKWLENFIIACKLPILFVSHDETLIEKTANMVIHIEQTRRKTLPRYTIAKIPYRQYIEERSAQLSHQEHMAKKEKSDFDEQQAKLRKIQSKVEHQQNVITRADPGGGRLLKKKMKAVKSMEKRFEKEHDQRTRIPDVEECVLIKFSNNIYFPQGKTVLDFNLKELKIHDKILVENIKLNVTGNDKICIIGKNGVGKTTLLKVIADELLARKDLKVAYMPQNYEDLLNLNCTPIEFLSVSGEKDEITKIRTYLGSMKYTTDEMEHDISELSGGQKAKVLFLKMILEECNVLLLDEPTRNFSPLSNPVVRDVLSAYKGAIISISHDRKYISEVCNKVYLLTREGLTMCHQTVL